MSLNINDPFSRSLIIPIMGPKGNTGASGAIGITGPQGVPGTAAMMGNTGLTGVTGATGQIGPTGITANNIFFSSGTTELIVPVGPTICSIVGDGSALNTVPATPTSTARQIDGALIVNIGTSMVAVGGFAKLFLRPTTIISFVVDLYSVNTNASQVRISLFTNSTNTAQQGLVTPVLFDEQTITTIAIVVSGTQTLYRGTSNFAPINVPSGTQLLFAVSAYSGFFNGSVNVALLTQNS